VEAVFADWKTAPVSEKTRAALGLVEALTLTPDALDLGPARAAGLSDADIEDAALVCVLFNLITRLADALGFEVLSLEGFDRAAAMLLKRGYA